MQWHWSSAKPLDSYLHGLFDCHHIIQPFCVGTYDINSICKFDTRRRRQCVLDPSILSFSIFLIPSRVLTIWIYQTYSVSGASAFSLVHRFECGMHLFKESHLKTNAYNISWICMTTCFLFCFELHKISFDSVQHKQLNWMNIRFRSDKYQNFVGLVLNSFGSESISILDDPLR